jgi:hypothetical protein
VKVSKIFSPKQAGCGGVHCNSSILEAEAGGLRNQGQPGKTNKIKK